MLWLDVVIALAREFGWQITLYVVTLAGLVITVRVLAVRLEKAYQREIQAFRDGHVAEVKRLEEDRERAWAMADAFRTQAERLADKYRESTELASDLADQVFENRRAKRRASGR